MQEAYVNGYWEELVAFTRSLFNSTFKMEVKVMFESMIAGWFENALVQIEQSLIAKGISKERIRTYGLAFSGKKVLIG